MKTITIKNNVYGDAPKVVGIIDDFIALNKLESFANGGVDIFEIRADLFKSSLADIVGYVKQIRNVFSCPFIGTVRETDFTRAHIAECYLALMPFVDIVDIELDMAAQEIIAESANKTSAIVMVSVHDFNKTPSIQELCEIVHRATEQGAQIIKIATHANSADDVTRLMNFASHCDMPTVVMCMGKYAAISRLVAPLYGSLFSYGYLREPLVAGQPSSLELARAFVEYYAT